MTAASLALTLHVTRFEAPEPGATDSAPRGGRPASAT